MFYKFNRMTCFSADEWPVVWFFETGLYGVLREFAHEFHLYPRFSLVLRIWRSWRYAVRDVNLERGGLPEWMKQGRLVKMRLLRLLQDAIDVMDLYGGESGEWCSLNKDDLKKCVLRSAFMRECILSPDGTLLLEKFQKRLLQVACQTAEVRL